MKMNLPDFSKLQPCIYETCISKLSMSDTRLGKESSDIEEDSSIVGNTLWFFCVKCRVIATDAESLCCLKKIKFLKVISK